LHCPPFDQPEPPVIVKTFRNSKKLKHRGKFQLNWFTISAVAAM
jgi:hypothetical protein